MSVTTQCHNTLVCNMMLYRHKVFPSVWHMYMYTLINFWTFTNSTTILVHISSWVNRSTITEAVLNGNKRSLTPKTIYIVIWSTAYNNYIHRNTMYLHRNTIVYHNYTILHATVYRCTLLCTFVYVYPGKNSGKTGCIYEPKGHHAHLVHVTVT